MKTEELISLGLTEEQANKVLAMNGKDIESLKGANEANKVKLSALQSQLETANKKLEGYDPEWGQKVTQAQKDADAKVNNALREVAAQTAVTSLKFTSESAKKAFVGDLLKKELPLQDGKLLGFDDFCKAYQAADPGAFAGEEKQVSFTASTTGPAANTNDAKAQANAAIRAAFGKE